MRTKFSLPHSLDTSFLDVGVMLASANNGIQLKRQITVRVLLIFVAGIFLYMFLIFQTGLGKGGFLGVIWWTLGYFWILVLLALPTETKQVGLALLMPMYRYIQSDTRKIETRSISPAEKVRSLVGIEGIVKSSGKVVFTTGEVGFVAEVVGNASILMFDDDQNTVLTDTRNFYRKLTPNVSIIIDSVTEPQRVQNQVAIAMQRQDNMQLKSPSLQALMNAQVSVLSEYVGAEFKSLHQYMVVRATNNDALREFSQWLDLQIEKGTGFLTDYNVLDYDEALEYFKSVYKYKE